MEHKNVIEIDAELKELIPSYLNKRKQELLEMTMALERGDNKSLRSIGHRLKGCASSYGFDELSILGKNLESAAMECNRFALEKIIKNIEIYLNSIEIRFIKIGK